MDKTTKEKMKTGRITAPSHMWSLILAGLEIKVRMIPGLREINFFIREMDAKLISRYLDYLLLHEILQTYSQ